MSSPSNLRDRIAASSPRHPDHVQAARRSRDNSPDSDKGPNVWRQRIEQFKQHIASEQERSEEIARKHSSLRQVVADSAGPVPAMGVLQSGTGGGKSMIGGGGGRGDVQGSGVGRSSYGNNSQAGLTAEMLESANAQTNSGVGNQSMGGNMGGNRASMGASASMASGNRTRSGINRSSPNKSMPGAAWQSAKSPNKSVNVMRSSPGGGPNASMASMRASGSGAQNQNATLGPNSSLQSQRISSQGSILVGAQGQSINQSMGNQSIAGLKSANQIALHSETHIKSSGVGSVKMFSPQKPDESIQAPPNYRPPQELPSAANNPTASAKSRLQSGRFVSQKSANSNILMRDEEGSGEGSLKATGEPNISMKKSPNGKSWSPNKSFQRVSSAEWEGSKSWNSTPASQSMHNAKLNQSVHERNMERMRRLDTLNGNARDAVDPEEALKRELIAQQVLEAKEKYEGDASPLGTSPRSSAHWKAENVSPGLKLVSSMVERSSMDAPRSITGVPHGSHLDNVARANAYIERQQSIDAIHTKGIKQRPVPPPRFSSPGKSGAKSLAFNTTGGLQFDDEIENARGGMKSMRQLQQTVKTSQNGVRQGQSFSGLQSGPNYSIAGGAPSRSFGPNSSLTGGGPQGVKQSYKQSTIMRNPNVQASLRGGASIRASGSAQKSFRNATIGPNHSSMSIRGSNISQYESSANMSHHEVVSPVTGAVVPVPPHPVDDYDLDVQEDDWLMRSPLPSLRHPNDSDDEADAAVSQFEDVPVVSLLLDSGSQEVSHPDDEPPDIYFDGRLLVDNSFEETVGTFLTLKTTTEKEDEVGEIARQQFAQSSSSAVFNKHMRRFGPFRGGVGHYRSGAVPQLENIDQQLTKGMNCGFVLYGQFRQRNSELILRSLMEDHGLFDKNVFCTLSCCEIVEEDVVRDLLDVNEFGHDYLPFEVLQHDELGASVRNVNKVALRHIHDFRRVFDFACYKSALYASHAQGLFDPEVRAFFARPLARYFTLEVVHKNGDAKSSPPGSPGMKHDVNAGGTRAKFVIFEMESMQESPIRAEAVKRAQNYFMDVNKASEEAKTNASRNPSTSFLKRNSVGDPMTKSTSGAVQRDTVPVHASKLSILLEELLCGNFHTNVVLGCTAAAFEDPIFATFDELIHGVHLDKRVAVERSLGSLLDILQFGQILSNLNDHRRKRRLAGTSHSLHGQHLQYNHDNRSVIKSALAEEIRLIRQDMSIPYDQKDREIGLRQALLRPLDEEEVHRHSEEILAQLTLLNKRYWFSLQASRELTSGQATTNFMESFGVPYLYNIGAEDVRRTDAMRFYLPLGQEVELVLLPGKGAVVLGSSSSSNGGSGGESGKEDAKGAGDEGERIIPTVTAAVDHHKGLEEVRAVSPNSFTFNYDDLFMGGSSPKQRARETRKGNSGSSGEDNSKTRRNNKFDKQTDVSATAQSGIIGKAADDRTHKLFTKTGKKIVIALPNVLELGAMSMLAVAHHFEGTSDAELVSLQDKLLSKKRLVDARYRPALSKWAKDNLNEEPQPKIDGLSAKLRRAGGGQAADVLRKGKAAMRATGARNRAMATRPVGEKFRAGVLAGPGKSGESGNLSNAISGRDPSHYGVHISLKNVDNRRIEMRNLSLSADVLVNNEISFGGLLHPQDQLLVGPYLFGLKVPKRDKTRPAVSTLQPLLMDTRSIDYHGFGPNGDHGQKPGGRFFFNQDSDDQAPPDAVNALDAQSGADGSNIGFLQALLALENGTTGSNLAADQINQTDLVHALVQQLNRQRHSNGVDGVFEGNLEVHATRNVCDPSGRHKYIIYSREEERYYTVDEFLTGRRDTLVRLAQIEQLAVDCDERLDSVGRSLGLKAQDKQALDLLVAKREMDAVIKRANNLLANAGEQGNFQGGNGLSARDSNRDPGSGRSGSRDPGRDPGSGRRVMINGGMTVTRATPGGLARAASGPDLLRQPTYSSAMKSKESINSSRGGSKKSNGSGGGGGGRRELSFVPPDRPFQGIVNGFGTSESQLPKLPLPEEMIPSPFHRRGPSHPSVDKLQRSLQNTDLSSQVHDATSKLSSPRETGLEEACESEKGSFARAAQNAKNMFPLSTALTKDKVPSPQQQRTMSSSPQRNALMETLGGTSMLNAVNAAIEGELNLNDSSSPKILKSPGVSQTRAQQSQARTAQQVQGQGQRASQMASAAVNKAKNRLLSSVKKGKVNSPMYYPEKGAGINNQDMKDQMALVQPNKAGSRGGSPGSRGASPARSPTGGVVNTGAAANNHSRTSSSQPTEPPVPSPRSMPMPPKVVRMETDPVVVNKDSKGYGLKTGTSATSASTSVIRSHSSPQKSASPQKSSSSSSSSISKLFGTSAPSLSSKSPTSLKSKSPKSSPSMSKGKNAEDVEALVSDSSDQQPTQLSGPKKLILHPGLEGVSVVGVSGMGGTSKDSNESNNGTVSPLLKRRKESRGSSRNAPGPTSSSDENPYAQKPSLENVLAKSDINTSRNRSNSSNRNRRSKSLDQRVSNLFQSPNKSIIPPNLFQRRAEQREQLKQQQQQQQQQQQSQVENNSPKFGSLGGSFGGTFSGIGGIGGIGGVNGRSFSPSPAKVDMVEAPRLFQPKQHQLEPSSRSRSVEEGGEGQEGAVYHDYVSPGGGQISPAKAGDEFFGQVAPVLYDEVEDESNSREVIPASGPGLGLHHPDNTNRNRSRSPVRILMSSNPQQYFKNPVGNLYPSAKSSPHTRRIPVAGRHLQIPPAPQAPVQGQFQRQWEEQQLKQQQALSQSASFGLLLPKPKISVDGIRKANSFVPSVVPKGGQQGLCQGQEQDSDDNVMNESDNNEGEYVDNGSGEEDQQPNPAAGFSPLPQGHQLNLSGHKLKVGPSSPPATRTLIHATGLGVPGSALRSGGHTASSQIGAFAVRRQQSQPAPGVNAGGLNMNPPLADFGKFGLKSPKLRGVTGLPANAVVGSLPRDASVVKLGVKLGEKE